MDKKEDIRSFVRDAYAQIATSKNSSCCGANTSCTQTDAPEKLAEELGYSKTELEILPEGTNMGLSCGNPTAIASLKSGEVVLDLGSGGGLDVFIAAEKVGASGTAIGVDMTYEMLMKARKNAKTFSERTKLNNVEFRLGEIEYLPVANNSVDAVISNCVINLSPNKPQVWKEIYRVLKPGGRAAVSDLALLRPLPENIVESVSALVGCVAGAVLIDETEKMIKDAGFLKYRFDKKPGYIEKMTQWNDPLYCKIIELLPKDKKLGDYITSLDVSVTK
ncbi:MAG TPA: arsenite S-adenosylmethyltransferase [Lentisphaeria bacterium]|nr:MAG: arsenite S-adenosylmethyltransferase [Lentisphaerae bacterium GWF2_38_69]HBM15292.1 arsenite S-adenosylmethyltransferase [Lentisphaeria bacterium]